MERCIVVKVVRCKDCKHSYKVVRGKFSNGEEWTSTECHLLRMNISDDWFCADGERRDDAEIH